MKKLLLLLTIFLVTQIQAQDRFTSFNTGQEFITITVDGLNKRVWAGTNQQGVFNLDIDAQTLPPDFSIFNVSATPDLSNIRIKSMAADALGNVWIGHQGTNSGGTQGGMQRISSNLNVVRYSADRNAPGFSYLEREGLATRRLNSVTVDKNNTVWVAQRNHNLTAVPTFIVTPGDLSFKPSNSINFITKGAWFNTLGGIAIKPEELPYPAFTFNPDHTEDPQTRNMQAISSDDTTVWVGVWAYVPKEDEGAFIPHRILRYDLQGNYLPSGTAIYGGFSFNDMGFPPGGVINGICTNNEKGAWVTTSFINKGFAVYKNDIWQYIDQNYIDSDGGEFSQVIPSGTKFNDNAIWKDKIGRVFMGTNNGLIIYNGFGNPTLVTSYKIYTNYDFGASSGNEQNIHDTNMLSNDITGGSVNPNNTYESWISTNNGIMKLFLLPEGMTLYHVKDHFSYSSLTETNDDNVTLLTLLKNELIDGSAIDSEIPSVAADNSGSTLFRFNTSDPEGYYNATPIYRFMVGPGPISQIDTPEYIKRYGQFSLKLLQSYPDNPTSVSDLTYVEFIYTHPEYIDESDYATSQNYANFDFKIIDVSDNSNPIDLFIHPIKIAVPPILLAHGVWTSVSSLIDIENDLLSNGYKDYMIAKAWRPDAEIAENSFEEDSWVIPSYINQLKDQAAANMFSAGKVNVIAHSRGGLYTRAYIAGIDPQYFYREDINSLITINTPHFGSQAANMALDKRVILSNETLINTFINNIIDFSPVTVSEEGLTIGDLGSLPAPVADRAEGWGALNLMVEIDNLSGVVPPENIRFIETLNNNSNVSTLQGIPFHAISTTFSACSLHPNLCNDLTHTDGTLLVSIPARFIAPILLYNLFVTTTNTIPNGLDDFTNYIYNGETNDVVVPLSSQKAGLEGALHNSHFTGIAHNNLPLITGVTSASQTHDKLKTLLRFNVHDETSIGLFTKNGITPSQLTYNFLPDFTGNSSRGSNAITSKILINKDPVIFDNVAEGDVLNYNIYAEDVDKIMVVYTNANTEDTFSYEIRENAIFENNFSYTIPSGSSGEITITATGYQNGVLGFATSTVNFDTSIPTGVTLQSIAFEQREPVILSQDDYSYNVIGSFSDGIDRIINDFDGLTYTIEDALIISQIDNSSIKGETTGSTLLTATIDGFEDTILVVVQENPSMFQTILTNFYGTPNVGNIDIFWKTLREYENATFSLETSYNTPDNFVEVNQQAGNGTITTPAQFSYSDSSFGSNTLIYYRLKMTSTSGGITYSSTILFDLSTLSIDNNSLTDINLKLYPNPIENANNVTLTLNSNFSDQNAKLELYNLQGKRLSLQSLNVLQGNNNFNLKLSNNLSSGIYLVKITTTGFIKTLKLVVRK